MKLAIDGGKPLMKKINFKIAPTKDEINSVVSAMKKGHLSSFEGSNSVKEFETKFASYIGSNYSVAFNTGTSAIHASVASMNAKPKGEIIVPTFTFITSVTPMLIEGLRPVFVDIDKNTLGMDPKLLKEVVNENTVGILPTHLLGVPCEIEKINKFAKKNDLFLIEDCAQAHGARVCDKKVGTIGDVGVFSFYLTKNMTTGEGGMAVTNNESTVEELKIMRQCGKKDPSKDIFSRLAFNYRMNDLSAAVGLPQLKKLDSFNNHRNKAANIYRKELTNLGLTFLPEREDVFSVYYKFPIILPNDIAQKRHYFISALKAENAFVESFYGSSLTNVEFLKEMAIRENYKQRFYDEEFLTTEDISKRLVVLPTHPNISLEQVSQICEAVKKVITYGNWS